VAQLNTLLPASTVNVKLPLVIVNHAKYMQFLYEFCSLIYGGRAAYDRYPSLKIDYSLEHRTEESRDEGRGANLQSCGWLWRIFSAVMRQAMERYVAFVREKIMDPEIQQSGNHRFYYRLLQSAE
jgi:hypothetical protein